MKFLRSRSQVLLITLVFSANAFALKLFSEPGKDNAVSSHTAREMVLGGVLKGVLENMHFSKSKINNDLSQKAFKQFIEKLDYGKQFLFKSDIELLSKFKKKIDDEIASGKLTLLETAFDILKKRQKVIEKFVFERLKKKFDLNHTVEIETDAEKRDFATDEKELKGRWEALLNYEVVVRYSELLDEKEEEQKKNKKKSINKVKLESEARDAIAKSYERIFKRINKEKRNDKLDKYFNSVAQIYDPHTHYLVPDDKDEFDIEMSGKLEGIGALLKEEGSYIKVEKVIPGSASWRGKQLEAGDMILKVAQGKEVPQNVVDMGLKDTVKLIRGKKGTEVKLTIKKPSGITKVISIIRDVVEIEASYVKSSIIEKKGSKKKYGYIYIPKFYRDFNDRFGRNCTDDTREAIKELKKVGIDGLILDLRNNGGGALRDAQYISGLFVKSGPIVQVKAHTGAVEILADKDDSVDFEKPMVVLINRFSASASEIVAAALQDYGRALIIGGDHSHGKGTVQAVLDLDSYVPPLAKTHGPFGALKITIQKFYRVTGGSTQYKGVRPDLILPDPLGHLETGERYLDYSLPWAKVAAVPYKKWKKFKYNKSKLNKLSSERVAKNEKFKKLNESVEWYKKRKEDTFRKINLSSYLKEKEEVKKETEAFEIKEISKVISIIDPKDSKKKEDKERFKEFSEELGKDPYIEETINILDDILSA